MNIKECFTQLLSSRGSSIPNTVGELLAMPESPTPRDARGGITIYELRNGDLMFRTCGNLKILDPVAKFWFRIAYEFARYGVSPTQKAKDELEEEKGS